ncbi:MAG: hypothetical protein JNK60_03405 [Acidobacteria bacterium]|nr:hypothetical protein [Acidobacteriota bacterium]
MKKTPQDPDELIRRLLTAAAHDGPPAPPSPFLLARLRAARAAAAAEAARESTLGLLAWKLVPAFAALFVVLSGATVFEWRQSVSARGSAMTRVFETGGGPADLLLAAAFLAEPVTPIATGTR